MLHGTIVSTTRNRLARTVGSPPMLRFSGIAILTGVFSMFSPAAGFAQHHAGGGGVAGGGHHAGGMTNGMSGGGMHHGGGGFSGGGVHHGGGGFSGGGMHHGGGGMTGGGMHHGGHHHSYGGGGYYGGNNFYGLSIGFGNSGYGGYPYGSSGYYGGGYYGRPYSTSIGSYSVRSYNVVPVPVPVPVYTTPVQSSPPVYRSTPSYSVGAPIQRGSLVTSSINPAVSGNPLEGELKPGMVLPDGAVVISVEPLRDPAPSAPPANP